ncbi:MAG: selenocysteine-specific translation elongation factor [Treponema sp.]|nr:MAG: selenocysteine-specific translation elongation factor [Treponema sp.]
MTGYGIENLRAEISKLLSSSKQAKLDTSFLYIDRSFNLKGIGTTITGTLRGKKLSVGDNLYLYPECEECRIKSIQNHHKSVEEIDAGSRTALNLKTGEKTKAERGMLLAEKDSKLILHGREFLIRVDEIFTAGGKMKNHVEVELALGSAHAIGALHFNQFDKSLARLSLEKKLACRWNQNAVLIRHGGSEILASCRVLAAFEIYKRVEFKEAFEVYRDRELPSIDAYEFQVKGFCDNPKIKTEELSGDKKEIAEYSNLRFKKQKLDEWQTKILQTAKNSQAGFTLEEVDIPVSTKIKQTIFKKLCSENKLENSGHIYKEKGRGDQDISKNARTILNLAKKAGFAGIEVDKLKVPQARKEVRDLIKLGKLVCLENYLHYHKEFYDKTVDKLLAKFKKGDRFSIADAREATGLSRKYVLPILNLLEKDKLLRRDGNERVVL